MPFASMRYDSPATGGFVVSRIRHILIVYAYAAVGVFLLAAPWSPVWEMVMVAFSPTPAGELLRSGTVRGFVSGLGGLNLWVALQEGSELWRSIREAQGGVERG